MTVVRRSFSGGTFYPNTWTVDRIEDEMHKKELNQVTLLGFEQNQNSISQTKIHFITATGRVC